MVWREGVRRSKGLHLWRKRAILVVMARQTGPLKITGTIDDICFYQMEGDYFARLKSSLTGKRFWKDKAFAGSRRSCGLMARASSLASRLYKTLPPEKKGRPAYQQLTGKVKLLLQQGLSEAAVLAWFQASYLPVLTTKKRRKKPARKAVPKQRLLAHLPGRELCQRIGSRTWISGRQQRDARARGQPTRGPGQGLMSAIYSFEECY